MPVPLAVFAHALSRRPLHWQCSRRFKLQVRLSSCARLLQSLSFDGQLMVLMVMLCSSLVVNVRSNLVESDLDRLACFTRMAKMINGERTTVR